MPRWEWDKGGLLREDGFLTTNVPLHHGKWGKDGGRQALQAWKSKFTMEMFV